MHSQSYWIPSCQPYSPLTNFTYTWNKRMFNHSFIHICQRLDVLEPQVSKDYRATTTRNEKCGQMHTPAGSDGCVPAETLVWWIPLHWTRRGVTKGDEWAPPDFTVFPLGNISSSPTSYNPESASPNSKDQPLQHACPKVCKHSQAPLAAV